jgi:hypothetical protein
MEMLSPIGRNFQFAAEFEGKKSKIICQSKKKSILLAVLQSPKGQLHHNKHLIGATNCHELVINS